MQLKYENSRDSYLTPSEKIKKIFEGHITGNIDAEYLDASRKKAFGICGLPVYLPAAGLMMRSKEIMDYIDSFDADQLFVLGARITHFASGEEQAVPDDVALAVIKAVDRTLRGIGEFGGDGEVRFDLKGDFVGPHYTVNLLLGNRIGFNDVLLTTPKSSVDAFGRGAFREAASGQVLASRYVLNMDETGEPANRQFYLVEGNKQIFYSADVSENVKSAYCTQMPNRTQIDYETECGLHITRTIFILPQYEGMPQATEVQSVKIENHSNRRRDLKIIFTGMFGIFDIDAISTDIVYVNIVHESQTVSKDGKIFAISPHHKPAYAKYTKRFAAIFTDGEPLDEYSVSYRDFIGNGTIQKPEGVLKLSSHPMRKEAPFFAIAKSFSIEEGASAVTDEFVGIVHESEDAVASFDQKISLLYEKFSDHRQVKKAYRDVIDFQKKYSSYLKVLTGDEKFDAYVNNDLPFQVLYQSFISRSFAWTQKSFREIGFREIQDMYASVYYMAAMGRKDLAKSMLEVWASNVYEMGYANHNFFWNGNGAGMCSDDQLWLVQAIYRYVELTGEYDILSEELPVAGSDKKRKLFDTMMTAVRYSAEISVGRHGLPLLDGADWNDCLRLDSKWVDGPTKEKLYREQLSSKNQEYGVPFESDLSESVMNAFLLKIAEDQLSVMAAKTGRTSEEKKLNSLSAKLSENIQKHAWKDNFFARCLINDPSQPYKYVGTSDDGLGTQEGEKGSYFLNSFSWSILSGVATEDQIRTMLNTVNAHIKTEAGLMLCSPCDLSKISPASSVGHYFHGDRENGAVFKHATMMSTAAMLKAAKSVEDEQLSSDLASLAFWMMERVLPYKTLENPYISKGNPRFCTQYVNSETLESVGPMLSGTASWLALTVFSMFGIEYVKNEIKLEPILPAEMENADCLIDRGGTKYSIVIEKGKGYKRINKGSTMTYDGQNFGGSIPDANDGKTHRILIKM